MIGLGMLWAAFAPVSLVALAALMAILLRKALAPRLDRRAAWAIAGLVVVAPVAAFWTQDRAAFAALCRDEGVATISEKAQADGILLTSGTSNSFGMRYLHDEGFAWMESNDIYKRGSFVRYARNDKGEIGSIPIDAPTARYEVRETFDEPGPGISRSRTLVVDRTTGKELAHAASLNFLGGRTRWALGLWGAASCPNAATDAAAFNAYYHLAKTTLR